MRDVTVVVATRNRFDKLFDMIMSITNGTELDIGVAIGVDGEAETEARLLGCDFGMPFEVITFQEHRGSVATRNSILGMLPKNSFKAVQIAVDDVIFHNHAIDGAFNELFEHFSNGMGMVGYAMEPANSCKTGMVLMGGRMFDIFPDGNVYCPDYYHFSAQELERLAERFPLLHYNNKVSVTHMHPGFQEYKHLIDKTHQDARARHGWDKAISQKRVADGKVWCSDEFARVFR